MPIARKNDNVSNNFGLYKNEKIALKKSDIEKDKIKLVSESLDIESHIRHILWERICQDQLYGSKLLSSLRKFRFNDQEFIAGTLVFNIKYHYPIFQIVNTFYLFHD